jgi:ABC-2 type transport system ATP-binding protein
VLLCTQYLDEADQLADRIAVIDHGRVIAEGTPGKLKASVGQGALHVRLLDPERREEAAARLGPDVHREADPAALTVPVAGADQASEHVGALTAGGVGLASFSLAHPSLDEVFLALTGHPAEEEDEA